MDQLRFIHWYRTRREFVAEGKNEHTQNEHSCFRVHNTRTSVSEKSKLVSKCRRFARYIRHIPSNNPGRGKFKHNSGRGSSCLATRTLKNYPNEISFREPALETIVVWQRARNTYSAAYSRPLYSCVGKIFSGTKEVPGSIRYNFRATF